MSNSNSPSREAAQRPASATSKLASRDWTGRHGLLRVRTGPEYPEGNLRELTRDSNPDCGVAREREEKKKKIERERELSGEKP